MSNRKVRYQLERFPELYRPVMICWIQVRFLDCNFKKVLNTEKPFKKLIIAYRQWKVWVQKAAGSNIDAIRLARLERNRSKFDNNRQRSRSLSNSSWEVPYIKFCQGNYTRMRWKLLQEKFRFSKVSTTFWNGCVSIDFDWFLRTSFWNYTKWTYKRAIYTLNSDKFHHHLSNAATMFLISSGLSFTIYILTFQQKKRKQLRDCSLILLGLTRVWKFQRSFSSLIGFLWI